MRRFVPLCHLLWYERLHAKVTGNMYVLSCSANNNNIYNANQPFGTKHATLYLHLSLAE